jgi:hypothetical protein
MVNAIWAESPVLHKDRPTRAIVSPSALCRRSLVTAHGCCPAIQTVLRAVRTGWRLIGAYI